MFDISLSTRRQRRCDGVSRRDFLRVGGLTALGLSLPQILAAEARAGAAKARAKNVILVYLGGGMSHHDTFDLKSNAPAEIRGSFSPIKTNVAGIEISEGLPKIAQQMDKLALVRSGSHNNDHHETATNWVLCGRFGSAFGDYPAMGACVAHEFGVQSVVPPYVAIPQNPSFTWELGKSAFLGGRYESFRTGDPNAADFKVRDLAPAEPLLATRTERRQSLLHAVDQLARRVHGNDQIATYDEFHQRAADMILAPEARDAFAIDKEDRALREQYGRTEFGQSCLLARRLIERGTRFVTVSFGGWDHHGKIFEGLEKKLPDFDRGFATMIEDLHQRGLLQDTLVAAFGEFGRSPKINKDAGRDHWGHAASLVFAGGGVRPGQVVGSTDKEGGHAIDCPVAPADVACTIYEALGISPQTTLSMPDGRPIQLLDEGKTIKPLFG
ncbi:MAG TPA: DUF1501 domain-containing protein [Pirellulales bacterium]|jgi:hypothetical protein|nr:DUF1501 domain-containing protein [Pirellulales bacterium]